MVGSCVALFVFLFRKKKKEPQEERSSTDFFFRLQAKWRQPKSKTQMPQTPFTLKSFRFLATFNYFGFI